MKFDWKTLLEFIALVAKLLAERQPMMAAGEAGAEHSHHTATMHQAAVQSLEVAKLLLECCAAAEDKAPENST